MLGVTFSPDAQLIATASRDKTARIWNREGELLAVLSGHEGLVWSVDFSPAGDRLLTASFDRTARVWLVDVEDLLRVAQQRSFRDFTADEIKRYGDLLKK